MKAMLDYFNADIICTQETKITRDRLTADITTIKDYITFYSFCQTRSGYSGVSVHVRESSKYLKPIKAQDGFTGTLKHNDAFNLITNDTLYSKLKETFTEYRLKALDNEGRCLILDHGHFILLNIYFPNGNGSEQRLSFKSEYHQCIRMVIDHFINTEGRHVVLVGDYNAKYQIVDSADPGPPQEFYDRESTKWFKSLVHEDGLQMIDTFKFIHPDFSKLAKKPFTCWDTYTFARASNCGTRIDYILCDKPMITDNQQSAENQDEKQEAAVNIVDAQVLQSVMGSDHCPVSAEINGIPQNVNGIEQRAIPKLACRFMPEFSGKQTNLMSFFGKSNGSKKAVKSTNTSSKMSAEKSKSSISRKRKFGEISQDEAAKRPQSKTEGTRKKRRKLKAKQTKISKVASNQSKLWGFVSKSSDSKENTNTENRVDSKSEEDVNVALVNQTEKVSTKPKVKRSSSEQWKSLFGAQKKKLIKCTGHGEEAILRTVMKDGPNKGRKFYVCPRGKGEKNDPEAQCNFFLWKDGKTATVKNGSKSTRKIKSW